MIVLKRNNYKVYFQFRLIRSTGTFRHRTGLAAAMTLRQGSHSSGSGVSRGTRGGHTRPNRYSNDQDDDGRPRMKVSADAERTARQIETPVPVVGTCRPVDHIIALASNYISPQFFVYRKSRSNIAGDLERRTIGRMPNPHSVPGKLLS